MFFVINKEKIYAYVVSIVTIIVLFFMSTVMKKDTSFDGIEETSTNVVVEKNMVKDNLLNTSVNFIEKNNTIDDLVPNN